MYVDIFKMFVVLHHFVLSKAQKTDVLENSKYLAHDALLFTN